MLLTDEMVETIVRTFFIEINLPRPRYWTMEDDIKLREKAKVAMIKAISKVDVIKPAYGSLLIERVLSEMEADKEK